MSEADTAEAYLGKAQRAIDGARLLLEAGDTEGACSRAYYAMFDAAHAGLRAFRIEAGATMIKTHSGLLTIFSKELVRTKLVGADWAKVLNQVQQLRLVADYTCEPPALDKTRWALAQAEAFVVAMRALIGEPG